MWRDVLRRLTGRAPTGKHVRFYEGAQWSRLMTDFNDGMSSADQANDGALRVLRDRARQLERDNAIAQAYVRLAVDNIVGPDGFSVQITTGDRAINEQIKAAFLRWCSAEHTSVDGRLSFSNLERLVVQRWRGADGEVLVRLWRGRGEYGLQLQVLDPDLLDETYSVRRTGDANEVRQGVEIDSLGRPVAFHLWDGHPSELGARQRVRVPASEIIHIARQDRPGQTRGITPFAPVLRELWELAGMQHAVLVGQRVAAAQMGFLVPTEPDADPVANDGAPAQIEAKPAAMNVLPYGYKVESWVPGQPTNVYPEFIRAHGLAIATGLGVTYSSLFGDARDANYGSQRGMLTRERRMWRADQEMLRDLLHERVFRVWLEQAAVAGMVRLRGASPAAVPVEWLLPTWDWIDPLKDTQSALAEVAAGLNSLTNVAAARGRDFAVILRQRAEELRLAEEAGVPLYLPSAMTGATDSAESAEADPAPTDANREALRVVRAAGGL